LAETAKRQPKTKKDHITTISLIELCTKYKDYNDDFTVVRDLSMITWCFSCFLYYDEISSIRCKDIIFKDDHLQIKILKSKTVGSSKMHTKNETRNRQRNNYNSLLEISTILATHIYKYCRSMHI
jgi:integrase